MSIYAISDLHLSFNTDKPMNIFGWEDYEKIIEKDWKEKVTDNDLVLLSGDFSWEMKLENTYKDFEFINKLPGKKILIKGNHDYWWNTLKKMQEYMEENNFRNIDFIYNNSYEFEDCIIVGTRGWNLNQNENIEENEKIKLREANRLETSILDGINKFGREKEIIACMHYPPIIKKDEETIFSNVLNRYNIKKCIYGHLHGKALEEVIEGKIENIEYIMTSCDYLGFKLRKIK